MPTDDALTPSEAARRYSQLGWVLTELRGKDAFRKGWPDSRVLEPGFAAGLWSSGKYGIGLVLGATGDVDFEYDDADGDTPEILAARRALYLALVASGTDAPTFSSSRKLHTVYTADNVTHATRPGFELRAGRHQTALPPTLDSTGSPKIWLPGRAPWEIAPPPLPAAVREFFPTAKPPRRRHSGTRGIGADMDHRWPDLLAKLGITYPGFDRKFASPLRADRHPSCTLHLDRDGRVRLYDHSRPDPALGRPQGLDILDVFAELAT